MVAACHFEAICRPVDGNFMVIFAFNVWLKEIPREESPLSFNRFWGVI